MGNRQLSLREKLLAEYLHHHLAHAKKAASGGGQRGCQFCPTLKVRPGSSLRGFLRPGLFPQRFYRDLTRDMNKIKRMALSGHMEAARFMADLERFLKSKPWDKPPASPGAILSAPLADGVIGVRAVAQAV
jgi:hypothetical protein